MVEVMTNLDEIPPPSQQRVALRIKPAAERAIKKGHPWLFDRSILRQNREGNVGDLAVVFDQENDFLAIGLYDPSSPLRVRILHSGNQTRIDENWLEERMLSAIGLRKPLDKTQTSGYRLVHGENDGLPGLVIDKYGETYVIRLDTNAWIPYLKLVVDRLVKLEPVNQIVLRLARRLVDEASSKFGLQDGQIVGGQATAQPIVFRENGILFAANVIKGQKTGFFFDQRENRQLVEELVARYPSLDNLLNVFAYTGAFSLYAARGGAAWTTNIDASSAALELAKSNFYLNREDGNLASTQNDFIVGDAFETLEKLKDSRRSFKMVIIDPPSFANRKSAVAGALKAYRRLAELGLGLLEREGLLVMASCSSRVGRDDFFQSIYNAASGNGMRLRIIRQTGHPLDHPVGFPQGDYLKCLFAFVDSDN